ncbi:polyketide synthase [Candidatus Laterigemmans baculatus]|uniref:polyketide synthase n=1 Tax=Candidatus Laterigemmans baculatus TaxID=2770505 RepID=UPI0013D9CFDF|nr:polyketide synthase [Candidatus Laterigemmans baculatus]
MDDTARSTLDPKLRSLLARLRSRIRRYIVLDSVLAALAVVLVVFWVGLLVDWGPVKLGGTEMPRSARIVLLVIAGGLLLLIAGRLLVGRLARALPDESLALLLERHHPQLGGRLITSVQLHRPRQAGDVYAPALLDRVHREAIQAADDVDSGRVFRWRPIYSKAALVVPLLIGAVALAIASPATFGQAASRLLLISDRPWPRQAELQMVGVEVPLVTPTDQPRRAESEAVRLLQFEDKSVRVARGGAATLRIRARAEGAVVPEVCTVYYRTAGGIRGQSNMRRVGRVRDGYQAFALDGPPLAGISEDLTLSVRGLDDRLDDYHVEVVDPPTITALEIQAHYPPYLRDPAAGDSADLVTAYQPGLRIREGTAVTMVGRTSEPVAVVEAAVTSGDQPAEFVPVDVAADGLSFALRMTDVRSPTTVVMVPSDANQISAPSPYRYFLGVVSDAPPEMQLRLRGIGSAVTPEVRLPIEGTATDDYAVEQVRIHVARASEEVEPQPTTRAVTTDREGRFETTMDLRDLAAEGQFPRLEPGGKLNVYGEATDAYDLGDPHITRTDLFHLDVITADDLLATLERRELGLRTRLEQVITETQALRDALDLLRREGWTPSSDAANRQATSEGVAVQVDAATEAEVGSTDGDDVEGVDRTAQLLRLRIQQAGLQADKTSQELTGIAASIDDILLEMVNNRVDSVDRRERIAQGVRDPLNAIVAGPLTQLDRQIDGLLPLVERTATGPAAAAAAVETTEQVLLQLTAVLERMLDLESYNEVLDLVRGLIDNQEKLIEATEREQTRKLFDL